MFHERAESLYKCFSRHCQVGSCFALLQICLPVWMFTSSEDFLKMFWIFALLFANIQRDLFSVFKLKESRYIALFMFSGSIKKFYFIDYVNIYLLSYFFSIDFARCKKLFSTDCIYIYIFSIFVSLGFSRWLPYIAYIVILKAVITS